MINGYLIHHLERGKMRKQYNEKEHKREWILEKWHEKTLYVLGWIAFVYLAFWFVVGFVIGLAGGI